MWSLHTRCIVYYTVNSQVTLLPQPGDVCYGDVVELMCVTTRDTSQYLVQETLWRENMMPLRVFDTVTPYSLQTVNIKDDKLIINITRGYFQNNMIYSYQCYYIFTNTSNDESGIVYIDPIGEYVRMRVCVCVFVNGGIVLRYNMCIL